MEIAPDHPDRGAWRIDRHLRSEDDVRTTRAIDQTIEPLRFGDLIIVKKRNPIGAGMVQTRVAGDRDIVRRRMNVANRELGSEFRDEAFGAGLRIIVDDDHLE
jgi:hypothetical protein